jgi:hypothetical protein
MKTFFIALAITFFATSCTVSKHNFNPNRKFSPEQLQEDYEIFRDVLEESHPSLYWYTSKDSVDYFFEAGKNKLKDSLSEYKFRNVLSYVLAQIRCGHTSVRSSKAASKYAERTRGLLFPLNIKAWKDTVVVTSNLSRRDSVVMRGALLKSIDNKPVSVILDSMFQHISADGYNITHKYQSVSNSGVFRAMYGSLYGLKTRTPVEFIDTSGTLRTTQIGLGMLTTDSSRRRQVQQKLSRKERKRLVLQSQRSMRVDTSLRTAFLEVNTFASGNKLRKFFRQSFRRIHKDDIQNIVVDMRSNGGGSVILSNLLTKYIAAKPFKIADSLYALKKKTSYREYQGNYFLNRLFFIFLTHKKKDGYYHFTHFENRYFKPKQKNHFDGTTYVLTGGNTFSAATLFTKALIYQPNVVVVGEETGGGAYGNTAWLIPDVTLPNTKVRFRLPLFRLVIDKNAEKGRGVIPEVEVEPTVNAIRKNRDYKIDKVLEMIKEKKK